MLLKVYSVYDECTESFGTPFFAINDKTAERAFFMLVNDSNSTIFQSPKDFSLHRVGSFDDHTGQLTAESPVSLIGRAASYSKEVL